MTGTEGPNQLHLLAVSAFARAAAAPGPVPGSGSVAAALGALGAGLSSMALGSARGEPEAAARAEEARAAMERLLACIDEDARAYAAYLEARAGRAPLGPAVEGSIEVPLAIARGALAALEGLAAAFRGVRPRLASEVLTAAHALGASVEGAAATAQANLPGLGDEPARARHADALAALRSRARHLVGTLDALLAPPLDPR